MWAFLNLFPNKTVQLTFVSSFCCGSRRSQVFCLRWPGKAKFSDCGALKQPNFSPVACWKKNSRLRLAEKTEFSACSALKKPNFPPAACWNSRLFWLLRNEKTIFFWRANFFACGVLKKPDFLPAALWKGQLLSLRRAKIASVFACGVLKKENCLPAAPHSVPISRVSIPFWSFFGQNGSNMAQNHPKMGIFRVYGM